MALGHALTNILVPLLLHLSSLLDNHISTPYCGSYRPSSLLDDRSSLLDDPPPVPAIPLPPHFEWRLQPLHTSLPDLAPPIIRLTRELEKKLSDKYIVFLSQRRVLPKPKRNASISTKQKRPRSRTLTAVHEKMLEDLVWPSEIVGKRTRVASDGGKLIRV